jgi:adenylate cyclase
VVRQRFVRVALGLIVVSILLGHAARFYRFPFVDQLDYILYDARLRLTMPGGIDDRIVILDIDEKSLAAPELGRWPWSRDILAGLVEKLFDRYGIAVLGFDVVFAEPDQASGLPVLERLAEGPFRGTPGFKTALDELRPQLDFDTRFAEAIARRPVLLGYYFTSDRDARTTGVLPRPTLPAGTFAGRSIVFSSWNGYGGNLAKFQAAATGSGHFNTSPDRDGVNRKVPILAEYRGDYYEPLALAIVRVLIGSPPVVPGYPHGPLLDRHNAGLEWLDVGQLSIPLDENACALIPFRGQQGSFPYISAADVYLDHAPAEKLKGKIVLVGATAPALFDPRATPVGAAYPGIEIHANLIAGMLDRNIKQRPPYALGAEVVTLSAVGLALAISLPFLAPLGATLCSGAVLLALAAFNIAVWLKADIALPLAASVLATLILFALNMAYGFFVESRAKRRFTELFGQYVPSELVGRMARDPARYTMEGRNEILTVMFADIRGFTAIAERSDPKALAGFLNEFLTSMSLVIRSHGGTLDKYIGDAIMAFWGAPVANPQHARQAVIAALAMQAELARLNGRLAKQGWSEVQMGVGINTGAMNVGDMGSKLRKAYTVIGDAVNVAARLEGLTRQYGIGILVGQATRDAIGATGFREVDRVRLRGKQEPLAIYEPIGFGEAAARDRYEELELWSEALKAYRAMDWDRAERALSSLQRLCPATPLYSFYRERLARYRGEPPPG